MILLAVGVVLLGVFVLRFRGDRRRFGNGVLLLLGLLCVGGALVSSGAEGSGSQVLVLLVLALSPLLVLALAGLLMLNGVVMLRREGIRPANLLSLGLGLALLVPYVLLVAAFAARWVVLGTVLVAVVLVASYLGFLLVAFLLYSLVYGWTTRAEGAIAIVVHGSGLLGDRVPPLLASRLDRALGLWRADSARGAAPLLVVSGGKGSDERIAEAVAMGAYLEEHGVPADAVLREDRSTTTRENLLFSKYLLAQRGIDHGVVLVTSNFHVLRTAMLARAVGLDAQVIGAPTARYYLPSALLREYVGVLAERKWFTIAACGVLAALPLAVAVAA
ncbi:YdcF family protein [Nocardia mangyaensis]|uniref:YdcF family protein n=1 Tax=Nocardia mangyaensis TaxID=2213200 RepID=UPI002676745B|nr:YdcF family protein [Nocardia mangyaensis]MDO3648606.1 YdcF family protein [Nocardia mangyaensis]